MVQACKCGKDSKYCCPKCKIRTCSLDCVRKHKEEMACTGTEDKTQFVKLSEFDNVKLISDYKFLEGIKEGIDSSHRGFIGSSGKVKAPKSLSRQCIERNIVLKMMPGMFSRHKENKSHFSQGEIKWTVELLFQEKNKRLIITDVSEKMTINEILEHWKTQTKDFATSRFLIQFFKTIRSCYFYVSSQDKEQPNTFHQLDPETSLEENLKCKTIIEFPSIFMSIEPHLYNTIPCVEINVKEANAKARDEQERKRKLNPKWRNKKQNRPWKKERKDNGAEIEIKEEVKVSDDQSEGVSSAPSLLDMVKGVTETPAKAMNAFQKQILESFGAF